MYGCWNYDSFGNRTSEAISTTPCVSSPTPTSWAHYNVTNSNRMDATSQNANQASWYDAAGDVKNDGANSYLYDAEGRICAVSRTVAGVTVMTGYLYDAGGTRVAKGSIGNMSSCDPAINGFQQATEHDYILGPGGEQMTEMYTPPNSTLTTAHANVWVGGILATYDLVNGGLHFALTDPLGTKRVQVSGTGVAELNCLSLPFGNSPGNPLAAGCAPVGASTAPDATEHHFTGKERDAESGNDYFGARYYASSMGRFMSPDWSAKVMPVPYAKMDNPQSLNLYAYVLNNPMTGRDPDGHVCILGIGNTCTPAPPPLPKTPDPAHVRPVNDHTVSAAPRTPIAVPARPAASLTVGVGASANVDAGVGVAGVEANGGYYKSASINTNGTAQLGDVLSGGAVAQAGSHVAGAPAQGDASSVGVGGAYAGVGLSGFVANTPTVNDLSGPFEVHQLNIPLACIIHERMA
jgi:RHS repeat-associated protein